MPSGAPIERRRTLLFACSLFVLSGACGLGYEVVWAKFLGLFLGNTVLLHTAVLSTFVGGLALGSLLIGRRAEQIANPLKVYGFLEVGIALFAILFPQLSAIGQSVVLIAGRDLPPGSIVLLAVKMLVGAAMLAVPTLLMGATFPVLTAHVERRDGSALGANGANWLYFTNCAGAVAGALLTGFLLIPSLGLTATVLGIGSVNLVIGLVGVVVGHAQTARVTSMQPRLTLLRTDAVSIAPGRQRRLLLAIGLSGATAFFYELVWTRLFAVTLGSSTYSFTLMLAAFITGLALGSAFSAMAPTHKRPAHWFAIAEALIGLVILASVPLYPRLPFLFWQWRWLLRPVSESIGMYHLFQYGILFSVMALPTFLFGLTFPTAIRAVVEGKSEGSVAPFAAAVYGWNTVGTLVGTLCAGCLLIPFFGLMRTLQVGAVLNLAIGIFVLPLPLPYRRGLALLLVPAFGLLVCTPRWHPEMFTVGLYRQKQAPMASWDAYRKRLDHQVMTFYREDFGATVAVQQTHDEFGTPQSTLIVDGKPDASSVSDMPTQALLAHLPLLFKPAAKDVFVLGLGSGVTAGNALTHPIERLDCVELSSAVIAAAKTFGAANHDPFSDPRFHLYQDDGKSFLAATPRTYDVVISEPTNPWIAGVGGLFTQEAFETQRRHLKPGGIVAQWFHSYELEDYLVATILRTFRTVFPHTVMFQGNTGDFLLLGSLDPILPDFDAMAARMQTPAVAGTLKPIRISSVPALLALQTHTGEGVEALAREGGINTDDYPLLEYRAPHAFYIGQAATKVLATDCRLGSGNGSLLDAYRQTHPLTETDEWNILYTLNDPRRKNSDLFLRALIAFVERHPKNGDAIVALVRELAAQGRKREALERAERLAAQGNTTARRQAVVLERMVREETANGLIP